MPKATESNKIIVKLPTSKFNLWGGFSHFPSGYGDNLNVGIASTNPLDGSTYFIVPESSGNPILTFSNWSTSSLASVSFQAYEQKIDGEILIPESVTTSSDGDAEITVEWEGLSDFENKPKATIEGGTNLTVNTSSGAFTLSGAAACESTVEYPVSYNFKDKLGFRSRTFSQVVKVINKNICPEE